jgi:hypothetical protein
VSTKKGRLWNMKKPHPLGRTEAESATLGVLTRIAMWFDSQPRSFTGHEVAEVLLTAWTGYEQSERTTLLET